MQSVLWNSGFVSLLSKNICLTEVIWIWKHSTNGTVRLRRKKKNREYITCSKMTLATWSMRNCELCNGIEKRLTAMPKMKCTQNTRTHKNDLHINLQRALLKLRNNVQQFRTFACTKPSQHKKDCRALLLHHCNSFIVILSLHFVLCCLLHTNTHTRRAFCFVSLSCFAFCSPTLLWWCMLFMRGMRQMLSEQVLTMTENFARKRANEHLSEQIE